jgi:flagellar hook-length control protein FliK
MPAVRAAVTNNTVEIPVSAVESAHKKSTDNGDGNNNSGANDNGKPANPVLSTAKIITVNDDGVEVPVSATESTNGKKSADGKTSPVVTEKASSETAAAAPRFINEKRQANANARYEAAVKTEQAAQNAANASGKSERSSSDHNNSHNTDINTADRSLFSDITSTLIENSDELNTADIDTNDDSQGVGEVKSEIAKEVAARETERAATAFSRLDNEAIFRKLTERMNNALRAGVQEIRMTLRPEALGEVRMSIRMQGDMVVAQMQVENRQVKALVEDNLQSLKDELAKQNINLGGFSVDVSGDSDRSSKQVWEEMAEAAELRRFRPDGAEPDSVDDGEADLLAVAPGSDTGRRFGSNTFEYFI